MDTHMYNAEAPTSWQVSCGRDVLDNSSELSLQPVAKAC